MHVRICSTKTIENKKQSLLTGKKNENCVTQVRGRNIVQDQFYPCGAKGKQLIRELSYNYISNM